MSVPESPAGLHVRRYRDPRTGARILAEELGIDVRECPVSPDAVERPGAQGCNAGVGRLYSTGGVHRVVELLREAGEGQPGRAAA